MVGLKGSHHRRRRHHRHRRRCRRHRRAPDQLRRGPRQPPPTGPTPEFRNNIISVRNVAAAVAAIYTRLILCYYYITKAEYVYMYIYVYI